MCQSLDLNQAYALEYIARSLWSVNQKPLKCSKKWIFLNILWCVILTFTLVSFFTNDFRHTLYKFTPLMVFEVKSSSLTFEKLWFLFRQRYRGVFLWSQTEINFHCRLCTSLKFHNIWVFTVSPLSSIIVN